MKTWSLRSPMRRHLQALAAAGALACTAAGATTYEVVHSFDGYDGDAPAGGLAIDADGTVYGTTIGKLSHRKQAHPAGTIFKIAGSEFKTLYVFHGKIASQPSGTLIRDGAGNLYGTTRTGGPVAGGTVYKFNEQTGLEVLVTFKNDLDGGQPYGGLVMDADGILYGMTNGFGTPGCSCGTVFKLDPATHLLTTLHRFNTTDGRNPEASLVLKDHTLYGTTTEGGPDGHGVIFSIQTDGTGFVATSPTDTLQGFAAGLAPDAAGNLWGAGVRGGQFDYGGLFRIDAAGTYQHVFDFNGINGNFPMGTPIVARDGKVYGTTYWGGSRKANCGCGTVYAYDPATGTLDSLHSFKGKRDGAEPADGLAEAPDGSMYGVTYGSGSEYNKGVVFRIVP